MGVILGIDIGGSSTKIVGLAPDLSVIDMLRVKADDPLTSLYGAMGNFLSTHHLQLSDIRHIALTGVGSSYVEGDIYGVKTIKVEEFPSVGVGGLALSGKEHAVVVSMGTGTSFLWANKGGEIRHLIGSGVGGGTLAGLSSLTTGVHQYALIRKLCQDGDLSHIDLTMADLSREQVAICRPRPRRRTLPRSPTTRRRRTRCLASSTWCSSPSAQCRCSRASAAARTRSSSQAR